MPTLPGKIIDQQGQVVAEMDVWVEVVQERLGGLESWRGACELPDDHRVTIKEAKYRLELSDGRSGDIIVTNLNMPGSASANLRFQGTGPLE